MPDVAAKRVKPSASRKTALFFRRNGNKNFVTNATLITFNVEIRVVNFASNLTRILTAEMRVVNVSTNTILIFGRDATRISGQRIIQVEGFLID